MPTRLQLALGTLIAGSVGYTEQLHLSQAVHGLVLLVAGVILFLLNPASPSPEAALEQYTGRPETALKPDTPAAL